MIDPVALTEPKQRREYNLVIPEFKFIFMPIYKAASSSINTVLKENYRRTWIFTRDNREVAAIIDDTWNVVTWTRHPLDRLVSAWRHLILRDDWYKPLKACGMRGYMPFAEFVERVAECPDEEADKHFRSQTAMLTYEDKLLPTHVWSFEDLATGYNEFRGMVGFDTPETLPHINKRNDGTAWQQFYDGQTYALARGRYADDLKTWYRNG